MAENEAPTPETSANNVVRPEELPPVEPPSAGFIVQLFLIPALIVAAVIGVWALFGKVADSETDWTQLVSELGSANEHRRWRAALGLAQVLRNEQVAAKQEDGEILARNPKVASALCELLEETLTSPSTLQEDVDHREFLARTLGSLQCDDIVLPTLVKTLAPDRHEEVRKSGFLALSLIAQRAFQQRAESVETQQNAASGNSDTVINLLEPFDTPTLPSEDVYETLRLAAQEEDASIRQMAAFTLGMISGSDAIRTLKAMLMDGDPFTRANAAVALARNGAPDGAEALIELIDEYLTEMNREDFAKLSDSEKEQVIKSRVAERQTVLRNCLRAAGGIYTSMTEQQKAQLLPLVRKAAADDDSRVTVEGAALLKMIE